MTRKNVFLNIELKKKPENPELVAKNLAQFLSQEDMVVSVQYRYGAFGRVDKVFNEQ